MANIDEAFPSQYLKASDLKGRNVPVVIDRVEFEPVGQSREMKPILYFQDKEKGLVLNKTNAGKIADLAGSRETNDWRGFQIAIYPTETSFQGDQVECIRVKSLPRGGNGPAPAPRAAVDTAQLTDDDIPF